MDDRLAEALAYAAQLHEGQVRKGTEIPYLSHLMLVAALVMEYGGDEDQVIAALLHDGPEDQGGRETLSEIRQRFGDRVAEIVESCTDTFDTPKPAWEPRKRAYLEHLVDAPESALLVSLADKVHNMGSIVRDYRTHGEDLWSRFHTDREGARWYYGQLLEIFEKRRIPQLAHLTQRLRRSFEEYEELVDGGEAGGQS